MVPEISKSLDSNDEFAITNGNTARPGFDRSYAKVQSKSHPKINVRDQRTEKYERCFKNKVLCVYCFSYERGGLPGAD